jgi:signal peptidase I
MVENSLSKAFRFNFLLIIIMDLEEETNEEGVKKNYKLAKIVKSFWEFSKVVIISLAIIIPIRTFIFQPFFVQGASMEPNFHDGEYLIVNEFGYKKTVIGTGEKGFFTVEPFREIERKDVIVFRSPKNPDEYFIKRVIGLAGDKIEIQDGDVVIYNEQNPDGGILDESGYLTKMLHKTECFNQCVFEIPEGEFLVMGDNRKYSSDSRAWGLLSEDYIIGKVLLRAWPFNQAQIF